MTFKIVYTDHQFDDLSLERELFDDIDAEVIDGEATDEPVESLVEGADALVVMYQYVGAELMDQMPDCQVINRSGIGFDNVDLVEATKRGIHVTNVPDYCIPEVSDHTIGLILALQRKVVFYNNRIAKGEWSVNAGYTMHRLVNQNLGLIAFGKIGREVCRKATALGMNVIVYDPYLSRDEVIEGGAEPAPDLEHLLLNADVVSVHAPLTSETRGMIGREELSMMKQSAFIINVGRGGIIDQEAVIQAIREEVIQGAALDVLETEPPDMDNELIGNERVILTPHAAWNSAESELERRRKSALSVKDKMEGKIPRYLVDREVLNSEDV